MSELTLCYVHGENIGYGRLGVKLSEALTGIGVDVYDDLGDAPPQVERAKHRIERETRREKPGRTNTVGWVSTPGHASWWWAGQHTSMFTMWEATYLPEDFRKTMHEFDTVIVPSMQNVELFSMYHPNVRYVPLGVDPREWKYTPRAETRPFFRFMVGGSGSRKGTDLTHEAFHAVFPNPNRMDPVPRLVMKNPKGESQYTDRHGNVRPFQTQHVEMVTGRLSGADEISLYESAHCYVQPSRGEGFGLQPLQAIAQGIPTILTNAHGHASYAHLGIPLGYSMKQSAYFIFGDAGDWWEPDFEDLCEAMRDVYDNYALHLERAKESAAAVARDWTWEHCAREYVKAHDGALDLPYTGSGIHHVPEEHLYLTILDRDYTAEIAEGRFQWRKGHRYYERADVKRILFESNVLDPACLINYRIGDEAGVMDVGLAKHQVERLPLYTGEREWCSQCGQRMNSGEQRSDFIEAELAADDRFAAAPV